MKLSLITLYVNDMEKSLHFYNVLMGLPITRRLSTGDGKELVFLGEQGQVNLELIPSPERMSYRGFSVGFAADDLKQARKRLMDHGYPLKHEMQASPVTMLCFFEGPNGEEVELVGAPFD